MRTRHCTYNALGNIITASTSSSTSVLIFDWPEPCAIDIYYLPAILNLHSGLSRGPASNGREYFFVRAMSKHGCVFIYRARGIHP